jgi:hypothetical protein
MWLLLFAVCIKLPFEQSIHCSIDIEGEAGRIIYSMHPVNHKTPGTFIKHFQFGTAETKRFSFFKEISRAGWVVGHV